jgi:DNA-binding winged helix-turn-helix (wHTH) protein/TolB-like protein/Flp pilus assembly protein TadD
MNRPLKHFYDFGNFRLDPGRRVLLCAGKVIPLAPKALEMLLALVENKERMLPKDELLQLLWPGSIVEEANLTQTIYLVRRALAEKAPGQSFIETIPKRGYRFVAPVELTWETEPETLARATETPATVLSIAETEPPPCAPLVAEALSGAPAADSREVRRTVEMASPVELPPRRAGSRWPVGRRWLALSLLCAGVSAGALFYYFWQLSPAARRALPLVSAAEVHSLAVLPFKALNANEQDYYLGLGLADVLSARLSRVEHLVVLPTSAVRKFDGGDVNPLVAGAELHVEAVLEGSFQHWNDRLRVTVRLLSVPDGHTWWAEKFDEKYTDIFNVQDLISTQVTEALALTLSHEKRNLSLKRYTENLAAYELYLKGRYWWNKRTAADLKKAITCFEQAIRLAPDSALAFAGLADCYNLLSLYDTLAPTEAFPKARAAAQTALQLDDSLAEAHTSLAWIEWVHDWDWPSAEREFKRALALGPNYAATYDWYGTCLAQRGQFEEALVQLKAAQRLDPLSLVVQVHLGWNYYYAGQFAQAVAQYQQALDLDHNYAWAHFHLGAAYRQAGRYDQARAELQQALTLSGQSPRHLAELACVHALSGKRAEAEALLATLLAQIPQQYVSPYNVAMVYAALDQPDQVFAWLHKAYETRAARLVRLNVDPVFKNQRSDPRFRELVQHIGLTPSREP